MPVFEINSFISSERQALTRELANEWQHPTNVAEPKIGIERTSDGKPLHVYVVWSKWNSVDRIERSEIVMDAAEAALPTNEALSITMAMGLTPGEASRMGLDAQF